MAAFPRRRSTTAATLAAALLAVICCHAVLDAFVGLHPSATRAPTKVPMRVNIFEGLPKFPSMGGEQDPEEVGTRSAREADESTSRLVEVNMPLGIEFEERSGGDIYCKTVDPASDAFSQGVRPGAQLVMVSATFGDEMWNARGVGMTQLMTVVNSRFGATMKLALEKEDKSFLSSFMEAFAAPKVSSEDAAKKEKKLSSVFEEEEAKLQNKEFWNPFR
uniref:PDZ domain-containing protein n=1 Tax=Alexandrium catenella TaxID=2925 RepID=A0A7S1WRY9_ALECA